MFSWQYQGQLIMGQIHSRMTKSEHLARPVASGYFQGAFLGADKGENVASRHQILPRTDRQQRNGSVKLLAKENSVASKSRKLTGSGLVSGIQQSKQVETLECRETQFFQQQTTGHGLDKKVFINRELLQPEVKCRCESPTDLAKSTEAMQGITGTQLPTQKYSTRACFKL